MWQYTTETIINSNKGKLAGEKRIVKDPVQNKLLIEGVGAFDLAKITKVWKRAYQEAKPAEGTLTIKTVTPKNVYRLQVWVSEEGTIRPELQNAMLMKSLPFQFEVIGGANATAVASDLEKAINKMFAKKGSERLFTVAANAGVLTLKATDCYVRFDNVKLDEIADSANLTGYQDYEKTDAVWAVTERGTEGNGTVARLVKNLRLPTKTSLDPFGADQGGKPVPGGEYVQYMFEYITDRSHVGHQVFGSVGDQSLTTHILFLNQKDADLISTFESCFAENVVEAYSPESNYVAVTPEKTAKAIASAQEGKGAKK
jgi:hypothetical protein